MYWLEPFVEVATPRGRMGYGPVKPSDVSGLFSAGLPAGGYHSAPSRRSSMKSPTSSASSVSSSPAAASSIRSR